MARQLLDWLTVLLVMRLMVAVIFVMVAQRLLARLQRVLDGMKKQPQVPNARRARNHRRRHSGLRRVRRPGSNGSVAFGHGSGRSDGRSA